MDRREIRRRVGAERQLAAFWPDVAKPFSEIIPAGCVLARIEDEWRAGRDASRRRLVEVFGAEHTPSLEELYEEACDDAFREGWTPMSEPGEPARYELENVRLDVTMESCRLLLGTRPVLRVQFVQAWPPDFGAPVETSDMFQNLVRNLLRIGSDPERLMKTVVFDPMAKARSDVLIEVVEMACPEDLLPRFDELSFSPPSHPGGAWVSTETMGEYAIEARVTKAAARVRVEMEKRRLVS